MKIYQLHKYGGEWEDSFDYIVASFLKKEKAEKIMAELQEEDALLKERSDKCSDCPYLEDWSREDNKLLITKMKEYCRASNIHFDEDGEVRCDNYTAYWDNEYFEIKEVEVEE